MLSLGWLAPLAEVEAVAGVDVVAETIVKAARSAVSVGSFAICSFSRRERGAVEEEDTDKETREQLKGFKL
jgi:hypothetical protein